MHRGVALLKADLAIILISQPSAFTGSGVVTGTASRVWKMGPGCQLSLCHPWPRMPGKLLVLPWVQEVERLQEQARSTRNSSKLSKKPDLPKTGQSSVLRGRSQGGGMQGGDEPWRLTLGCLGDARELHTHGWDHYGQERTGCSLPADSRTREVAKRTRGRDFGEGITDSRTCVNEASLSHSSARSDLTAHRVQGCLRPWPRGSPAGRPGVISSPALIPRSLRPCHLGVPTPPAANP